MESFFETYKSSTIHYRQSQALGKKLLLCLHGYGEQAASFDFMEGFVGQDYTLIAIDLPFHGKTEWEEGLDFSCEQLLEICERIVLKLNVDFSRWHLIGYSMGGRVALDLLESVPGKIGKLILLAPDGLQMNPWYWLATQQSLGNWLFRLLMKRGGFFLGAVHFLHRLKLINQSIYKFMNHYIKNRQVRMDLYQRWTTMRHFRPDLEQVKKDIAEFQIPVRFLYGRYDRIIRFERGLKFAKGLEKYCQLEIIETGHQVLSPKNIEVIARLIKE